MPKAGSKTVVELRWRGRTLVRARAPARRCTVLAVLPVLRRAADALTAEGIRQSGRSPSCRSGCAACCRQLVPLADAEARELRAMVRRLPGPRKERLAARFAHARAKLNATGMLDLLAEPAVIPPEGLEDLGRQYLAAWIDCPFLEKERCTIYERRPMACRQHVVSSDPGLCTLADGNVKRLAPSGAPLNAAIDAAEKAKWIPLISLLGEPAHTKAVTRRDARDWLEVTWDLATNGEGRVRIT